MAAVVLDGAAADVGVGAHEPDFQGVGFDFLVAAVGDVLSFEFGFEGGLFLALFANQFDAV